MSGYVEISNIMCELTKLIEHPGGAVEMVITPPSVAGRRPFIMIFASASDDFELQVAGGDFRDVVAAAIDTAEMDVVPIGINDNIVITSTNPNDIVVRWIFQHPRANEIRRLSTKTLQLEQDTNEAELIPPANAVELSITDLTDDLMYRIDDRSYDGPKITLDDSMISISYPYNIPVFPGHRLRLDSPAGTVTLRGYWLIGHNL